MSSYYYNYDYDDDAVSMNNINETVSSLETTTTTMDYYVSEEQKVEETSLYFVVFSTLLIISFTLCKMLHNRPTIHKYISEAALVLMIGMIAGLLIGMFLYYFRKRQQQPSSTADYYYYDSDTTKNVNPLGESWLSFNPNIFFMALLPPIIFHSGYQLRRELFYRHITPILLFSVIGTTIAALSTGWILYGVLTFLNNTASTSSTFAPTLFELLTFGSLIAATDTVSVLSVFQSKRVDPHLFYLVFGESALNDAVALVLFHTFAKLVLQQQEQQSLSSLNDDTTTTTTTTTTIQWSSTVAFVFQLIADGIGSPIIGIVTSFGIAYLFKHVDFRTTPHLELPLYIVLMYIPFVLAECLSLSGIITIFFSGISARRYIVPNVSIATANNAEMIFQTASYVAEICIFLELGLSVFGLPLSSYNWSFIALSFVASLLGRAVGIYPLAFLFNLSLKERIPTVPPSQQQQHQQQQSLDRTTKSSSNYNNMKNEGSNPSNIDSTTIILTNKNNSNDNTYTHNTTDGLKTKTQQQRTKNKTPSRRRDKKIPPSFVHILWFVGLRGAVAYACARQFPNVQGHADEMMACTMIIVLISIIGMGGIVEPLLYLYQIQINVDEKLYMKEWHKERYLKGMFHEYENALIYRTVVREGGLSTMTTTKHNRDPLMRGTSRTIIYNNNNEDDDPNNNHDPNPDHSYLYSDDGSSDGCSSSMSYSSSIGTSSIRNGGGGTTRPRSRCSLSADVPVEPDVEAIITNDSYVPLTDDDPHQPPQQSSLSAFQSNDTSNNNNVLV